MNMVFEDPPELGIMFTDQSRDGIDRHFLDQKHDICFEKKGKTTSCSCPGNFNGFYTATLWAVDSGHPGMKVSLALEKI